MPKKTNQPNILIQTVESHCRPKAALLFEYFGDFRCGVSLVIVILVMY